MEKEMKNAADLAVSLKLIFIRGKLVRSKIRGADLR